MKLFEWFIKFVYLFQLFILNIFQPIFLWKIYYALSFNYVNTDRENGVGEKRPKFECNIGCNVCIKGKQFPYSKYCRASAMKNHLKL